MCTGTSVVGVVFDGGVIVAADTLASYGSMARFRSVPRVLKLNSETVVACGGDYADFQYLANVMEQKQIDDECRADGHRLSPVSLFSWLTRIQYQRRSKFDPLWCSWLVAGMEEGKPFLGSVDKLGTAFTDDAIATGYGAYIATPLLREWTEKRRTDQPLTQDQAHSLVHECMRVLFCRDARSFPKYQVAVVTAAGSQIQGPIDLDADWGLADFVRGYE